MRTLETRVHVAGLRGRDVFGFLLNCTDEQYRRWWPGTHLEFRTLKRCAEQVGSLVYLNELVGQRRVRMRGRVTEVVPNARIVWQFRWVVPLPVWLRLDLADNGAGVTIRHTIRAGFDGLGRVLDPVLRLYFSPGFARDLDALVRSEFPKLRDLLAGPPSSVESRAPGPVRPARPGENAPITG